MVIAIIGNAAASVFNLGCCSCLVSDGERVCLPRPCKQPTASATKTMALGALAYYSMNRRDAQSHQFQSSVTATRPDAAAAAVVD